MISKTALIVIAVVSLAAALGVGVIIGYFSVDSKSKAEKETLEYYKSLTEETNPAGLDRLLKLVSVDNLKKNLR